MKRLFLILALLCAPAFGQALSGVNGDCQIGGQQALISGLPSTATQQIGTTNVNAGAGVQASFPQCLVTVYASGTTNKANIYSNNTLTPTVLSNPFVANVDGSYVFFAAAGCFDVSMSSGSGPALPYPRTLSGICVGQGTVTIPGGSGTVGACGTPGGLSYYSVSGTAVTCDPNFVTDGAGNAVSTSMTFNGAGAGFVGFVQGTVPPLSVANTAYLYSDTSIPTTFGTVLPTAPGLLNQVLAVTSVVDATHIKTGWIGGTGGCPQGTCLVNAPTADQTVTGAHALILSNSGSNLTTRGTLDVGPAISSLNSQVQSELGSPVAVNGTIVTTGANTVFGINGSQGISQVTNDGTGNGMVSIGHLGLGAIVSGTTNTDSVSIGLYADAMAVPAVGTTLSIAAPAGEFGVSVRGNTGIASNQGAGTIDSAASFWSYSPMNLAGGFIHQAFDFYASANGSTGDTLNALFYGENQGSAAHDYGIYLNGVTHNDLAGGVTKVGSLSIPSASTAAFGSAETYASSACETNYGITTLNTGGTTTDTGLNCLPANSIIDAVVARVTTTITAACTGWELGDATTPARFSSNNATLTSGTTTDAAHIGTFNNTGIASATTGIWQASAAKVRITCAGGNPGAGAIRVVVYYHSPTAPTS